MQVRITIDAEVQAATEDEAILMGIAKKLADGIVIDAKGENDLFGKYSLVGGTANVARIRGPKKKAAASATKAAVTAK